MTFSSSMIDPGHPCVMMTGNALGFFERTWWAIHAAVGGQQSKRWLGEDHDGVVVRDNKNGVMLRTMGGEIYIKTEDVSGRRLTGRSLMPVGFETLGGDGLRDVLACGRPHSKRTWCACAGPEWFASGRVLQIGLRLEGIAAQPEWRGVPVGRAHQPRDPQHQGRRVGGHGGARPAF